MTQQSPTTTSPRRAISVKQTNATSPRNAEHADEEASTKLSISFDKVQVLIPSEFERFSGLEALTLHRCPFLETLPTSLGRLQRLQELTLDFCPRLESLPDRIGDLSQLKKLEVSFCYRLQTLPPSIGALQELTEIMLEGCDSFAAFPAELGSLGRLEYLMARCCPNLQQLPETVQGLKTLKELHLVVCKNFHHLPESIGDVESLTTLRVWSSNVLSALPSSVGQLHNLTELSIVSCPELTRLPAEMGALRKLHVINFARCGLNDWDAMIETQLPPRLRVLRLDDTPLHEADETDDAFDLQTQNGYLARFLRKNCYLTEVGKPLEESGLDHVLDLNFFRPILPGGHVFPTTSTLPLLVSQANKRLDSNPSRNATIVYTLLHTLPWWDSSVHRE